jgi:hypothetical protein
MCVVLCNDRNKEKYKMSDLKVNCVNDAIRLAYQLKVQKKYDYFRGQTCDWPVTATLQRLTEDQYDAIMERVERFVEWFQSTPGLESFANDVDTVVAIAQHYGIPTNFIDFSTEPSVAGFFATHSNCIDTDQPGCIICVNVAELMDAWRDYSYLKSKEKYPPIEILTIDVHNLWRLQAQHGVFLFCPYPHFDTEIYPFDRIYFPHTEPSSDLTEDDIYPKRKSQLEILLDQYFMTEALSEGTKRLYQIWDGAVVIAPKRDIRGDADLLIEGKLPPRHLSWNAEELKPWIKQCNENYFSTKTDIVCNIVCDSKTESHILAHDVARKIINLLNDHKGFREKLLIWSIYQSTGEIVSEKLNSRVQRLWDGIRLLPYDTDDIAMGIGNCIALYCRYIDFFDRNTSSYVAKDYLNIMEDFFGDGIEIEFGAEDESYSKSFASTNSMLVAVRSDIESYLAPAHKDIMLGNITGLLQAVQAPDCLFDFNKLVKVFAREIIPIQILMREGLKAVYFSPARMAVFGLP